MKRQGIVALQEKEMLLQLIEKKSKDSTLIKKLTELRDAGRPVESLTVLKNNFDEQTYNKLIKGVFH